MVSSLDGVNYDSCCNVNVSALFSNAMLFRNNDSFVTQRVTVPDTITSWVADAFAVSQSTAMTIASPATLTVFKPFFLTINLPYSVIRGEMAEITLTLFNYKQNNIAVRFLLLFSLRCCLSTIFAGPRRPSGE